MVSRLHISPNEPHSQVTVHLSVNTTWSKCCKCLSLGLIVRGKILPAVTRLSARSFSNQVVLTSLPVLLGVAATIAPNVKIICITCFTS